MSAWTEAPSGRVYVDARDTCPSHPIPRVWVTRRRKDGTKQRRLERWARALPRDLEDVTGVCFHVTAVSGGYGVSPSLRKEHDGDDDSARLWRYTTGRHTRTYHWIADHRGKRLIRKLPATVYSHASTALNRSTIAYAYDSGSGGPFDLDFAVESIVDMIEEERRDGTEVAYGYAHRQSDANRGTDPGDIFWQKAVTAAARLCKLELLTDFTVGSGRTIPDHWRAGGDS